MNCHNDFLSIEDAHFDYLTENCTKVGPDDKSDMMCNFDAWPIVNGKCGGKNNCEFKVGSELFGNVCNEMAKKLIVTYACLKGKYWCRVTIYFYYFLHSLTQVS